MTKPPVTTAVRTVSETDDVHVIEGLAFPFRGRDTYGTFFSARTNFEWGLFSDVLPGATRADEDAKYIRPATFHHGFDPDFGLTADGVRVGGWSPVRTDVDGVWVRAQLDKRHKYYETRLKPLLAEGALGLSGGSAEHSVRIDNKTGEILDWPAYELALTNVESNPLAQIAARAGDVVTIIAAREAPAEEPVAEPEVPVEPEVPAARAGKRNNAADQANIQSVHDMAVSLGADCLGSAGRSAEVPADDQPATITVAVREDAPTFEQVQARLAARASDIGAEAARRLVR